MKHLVIVESPTKAKTIQKFLGNDYEIIATFGHVRDLPKTAAQTPAEIKKEPWATLAVNIEKNFEPVYVVPPEKKKLISELKSKLKGAGELILATDEDREGESISWHVLALLKPKKSIPVKRMVFHEITKEAIQDALKHCRDIDENLVKAQEARRILDRLVGYTLSPLLWKKIATGLSAGRVQSVALKLIVDLEWKRIRFIKNDYWDLKAELKKDETVFPVVMTFHKKKKICSGKDFHEETGKLFEPEKVTVLTEKDVLKIQEEIQNAPWKVKEIEEKKQERNPSAPFTTSSLQQESNRKLKMSSKETMRVAQSLYEKGFITYMRTDSVSLSEQAIHAARNEIQTLYGKNYLPTEPRKYSSKAKNSQEAHEAIRPAGSHFQKPANAKLVGKELVLYEMIWKRTLASQMKNARLTMMNVKIRVGDCEFRASGKKIDFPGFFRAYVESSDNPDAALEEQEVFLPKMFVGETLDVKKLNTAMHETKPPARYTEASLVKNLEINGVGRPSTYSSIITTIIDRKYVQKIGEALVPTFVAFTVSNLLTENFGFLVDTDFTAMMEQSLDDISTGKMEQVPYLKKFYAGKKGLKQTVEEKTESISPIQYRQIKLPNIDARVCVGKYGPYLEIEKEGEEKKNSSIPHNIFPADLTQDKVENLLRYKGSVNNELGQHPTTGQPIYLLTGNYGPYVQLGETISDGPKPKRISIPKNINENEVDLETAIKLLGLPRTLGNHPDGGFVQAHIGRFGPYVVHDSDGKKDYRSLKQEDSVIHVNLERALELLKIPKGVRTQTVAPLKELGNHPEEEHPVNIHKGPYGYYIKYEKLNVAIPKDIDWETLTLEQAMELIQKRKNSSPAKRKGGIRRVKK